MLLLTIANSRQERKLAESLSRRKLEISAPRPGLQIAPCAVREHSSTWAPQGIGSSVLIQFKPGDPHPMSQWKARAGRSQLDGIPARFQIPRVCRASDARSSLSFSTREPGKGESEPVQCVSFLKGIRGRGFLHTARASDRSSLAQSFWSRRGLNHFGAGLPFKRQGRC